MDKMDTSIFQGRVSDTLTLLIAFGRMLQAWEYKTPTDSEIMGWVYKFNEEFGMMEWLNRCGIEELRAVAATQREQLCKAKA